MSIKKLFFATIFCLCTSPLAFADELGTGSPSQEDELGTGTPAYGQEADSATAPAGDELGTGGTIDSVLAWWNFVLSTF